MRNLQVTLAALLVWGGLSAALLAVVPLNRAMPFLLLGLCLVPVAVFLGARSRKPKPVAPPPVSPRAQVPPEALTEENLRRVFGEENVARAWAPWMGEGPVPAQALEKLGGAPAFVEPVEWPRCRHCGQRLTFLAQLAVGPERPLRYPEEGVLYVFLCQRIDPGQEISICPSLELESGAERCFVQRLPGARPVALTLDDSGPRLSPERAVEGWESHPSVRLPSEADWTPEQSRLYAAVCEPFGVQVGGMPDWVQSEETPGPCACGAERELVLEFGQFTEDLNLGMGRAYVFACCARHAPEAFWLLWQAS